METKTVKVKAKKVDDTIAFNNAFGFELVDQQEEGNKVLLTFERDKERFEGNSYQTIRNTESLYSRISRPFPLAGTIMFVIASVLLACYFLLQKTFPYYIAFLFASLTCYGVAINLLIIFLVIFAKRRSLLKRVVKNVALEAGPDKEFPLQNNIKKETDKTWLIANNL